MPSQGDIVLIPIPFTDLSSSKRRPVIIISHDDYHRTTTDMIVVAMTSNPNPTPYSFTITNADVIQGRLNRPGNVRVDKIYTVSQTLAVRTFGRVDRQVMTRIRRLLDDLTHLPTP